MAAIKSGNTDTVGLSAASKGVSEGVPLDQI